MPEIISGGHLYVAVSPLYRVSENFGTKKEKHYYFFNNDELEQYKQKTKTPYHIDYIKGLGELQPRQLWESTMDPANRRMIKITAEDAQAANQAIEVCMGDNVDIRRKFILENANFEEV